jgi:L-malate glycosyltransferase
MKKVLIIYKFLPQYRLEFFQQLKIELNKVGIELELVYGKLKNTDSLKKDEVDIDWAYFVPNKIIRFGKTELLWQPCLAHTKNKDLIIVEQANKLLINYYFSFARHFKPFKFAFWGHGRNLQEQASSIRNKFKYKFLGYCDWWFAYTEGVKRMLQSFQYPGDKITVVQNAIDTKSLIRYYHEIPDSEIDELKKLWNITGDHVGIYCGGMYMEKRLDFILEACQIIKKSVPDFHMVFVGSGINSNYLTEAEKRLDYIHYVGPKFGKERVKYFKVSSVQLMPGVVGLGILDSFALQSPIITTELPFHGPEIEYLENGVNGIITPNDINVYTQTVIDILLNKKYLSLIEGCVRSADVYTIENMVTNFKNGILKCLNC